MIRSTEAKTIGFIKRMLVDVKKSIEDEKDNEDYKAEFYIFSGEQDPFAYKKLIKVFSDFINDLEEEGLKEKFVIKFFAGKRLFTKYHKYLWYKIKYKFSSEKSLIPATLHPSFSFIQKFSGNTEFFIGNHRMPIHIAYSPQATSFLCETIHTELVKPFRWSVKNSEQYRQLIPKLFTIIKEKYKVKPVVFKKEENQFEAIIHESINQKAIPIGRDNIKDFFKSINPNMFISRRALSFTKNNELLEQFHYLKLITSLDFSNYILGSQDIFSQNDIIKIEEAELKN